jgi:hypothetical protein
VIATALWAVAAPALAAGMGLIGSPLIPLLEGAPGTRYVVEDGRLVAQRPTWLPIQKKMSMLNYPLWHAAGNYGVPLLAALILATPGWGWRRRGRSLAIGLGLIAVTQVVFLVVTILATQQSPVMSPDGMITPAGYTPLKQHVFYSFYTFFEVMGRGFFTLLIYLALIALEWRPAESLPVVEAGRPAGRNDPCPCGSGLKYKRCCGA